MAKTSSGLAPGISKTGEIAGTQYKSQAMTRSSWALVFIINGLRGIGRSRFAETQHAFSAAQKLFFSNYDDVMCTADIQPFLFYFKEVHTMPNGVLNSWHAVCIPMSINSRIWAFLACCLRTGIRFVRSFLLITAYQQKNQIIWDCAWNREHE